MKSTTTLLGHVRSTSLVFCTVPVMPPPEALFHPPPESRMESPARLMLVLKLAFNWSSSAWGPP
jgi:hypothetical protein